MAPQDIAVDTNCSCYPQETKHSGTDVNTAASEEIPVETNGSCEIGVEEASVISTPDQVSLILNNTDKAVIAAQVIPACSSLPTSTPDQPTESVQDATMQSKGKELERSNQLITNVQDVSNASRVLDQCGDGLPVTVDKIVGDQGGTEQSNEEQAVSSVQLVSVDQCEISQPMEVDQFAEPGETDHSATDEQSVPDQSMASAQVGTDSSVAAQDKVCHTVTGLSDGQIISEDQSESVQLMAVDDSVNDQLLPVDQSETDQVMEIDESGINPCAVEDQVDSAQPATGEQHVVEQFAVSPVDTDQSIVKGLDSACQIATGIADEGKAVQLISGDQAGAHELEAVDNCGNDSVVVGQGENGQSVTEDQTVTKDQLRPDDHLETDNFVVESQDEIGQTEMGLVNEDQSISGGQSESDQLVVFDSENDHSVAAGQDETGQTVTEDQTVKDQFMPDDSLEMDHSVEHSQDEARQTGTVLKNESVSISEDQSEPDQLMVFGSGSDHSVTAAQSVTGESEIADASLTEQFMVVSQVENDLSLEEGQDEAGHIDTGFPSGIETSRLVSEDQSGSDQVMEDDDAGNDQSVTVDQDVTCQSVTGDQSVPDQFIAVGQVETDQRKNAIGPTESVPAGKVVSSHLVLGDQCGSDQLMVESENAQSAAVNQGGTVQSVLPNEIGTSQFVLGEQCESDHLMVAESRNDQSVTGDRSGTGQSLADQTLTDAFVEVPTPPPVTEDHTGSGFADEGGTCQVASGNLSGTDQLVVDEPCGNDQSVVEAQGGTILAVAFNQSVPDQSMDLSQGGTDQIVPGNQSEIVQSITVVQVGPDHPQVASECGTNPFNSAAPDSSDQEAAVVHVCLDQPSAITPSVTDHCTPASPGDITDHPITAESEGTHQSEVKDVTDQVVTLDGTGPDKIVFTPYDAVAREEMLKEICNIKFFSIVTEEEFVMDGQAYVPVAIYYLNKQDIQCENILAFIPLSTNIASFVDTLTITLSEKWGLNLALCRSQTLARPGASFSQMTQASALLSQRLPHAFTFPKPGLLSLLASLSSLREITHSFECLDQMFMWFSEDVERRVRLEDAVVHLFQKDERKASELKEKISNNQLVMSHEVLEHTSDILEAIVLCLKGKQDNEANTAQAQSFLSAVQNFDFILTVVIMKNILSLTKNLSLSLQGNSYDVYQAVNRLSDLLPSLSEMKNSIESHHQTWFHEAVALASKLQVPSQQPPLNVHYKEDVSKRAIEHCIAEVEGLSQDVLSGLRCLQVVPYVMSKVEGCCKDVEFVKVFQDDLPDPNSFQAELQRWRDRWQDSIATHQQLPDTVLGALKTSDIQSFPNISTILRLLAVLPLSSMQSSLRQGKMKSELYPLL